MHKVGDYHPDIERRMVLAKFLLKEGNQARRLASAREFVLQLDKAHRRCLMGNLKISTLDELWEKFEIAETLNFRVVHLLCAWGWNPIYTAEKSSN
ncbi:hypothetical protein [Terasakiella pusilla]|uniref:hypothetical protein n=1 Tax=Terasakiella pusilla TaxID=64973 RepID=UPI003AA8658C